MKVLLRNELKELIERPRELSASIYMPTHRTGSTLEGPARIANLLDQSERNLVEAGMRGASAKKMLEPARALQTDADFWRRQGDGLALFIGHDFFRYYRLPFSFPEMTVASARFHIKPLIQLFGEDRVFYVLALSQKSVRLVHCTPDSCSVVTAEKVPGSLAEYLRRDSQERQSSYHAGSSKGVSGSRGSAIFHNQGGTAEWNKDNIQRFFGAIDKGLHEPLRDEKSPLIIAGADFLHPLYHKENTYPCLLPKGIEGNPDEMSLKTLQQKGIEIAKAFFEEERTKALRTYNKLAGSGQTSSDLSQVVVEAHDGHIFKLFVAMENQLWGSYNSESRSVTVHEKPQPGDDDLLDLAAERALVTGASVYVMPAGEVPGGAHVAAVLRYSHVPAAVA